MTPATTLNRAAPDPRRDPQQQHLQPFAVTATPGAGTQRFCMYQTQRKCVQFMPKLADVTVEKRVWCARQHYSIGRQLHAVSTNTTTHSRSERIYRCGA
jgi:hypothetical protein